MQTSRFSQAPGRLGFFILFTVLFLAANSRAEESTMMLAMARPTVSKKMDSALYNPHATASVSRQSNEISSIKPLPAPPAAPSVELNLEKAPATETSGLIGRAGNAARPEIRPGIRGHLQLGFGQLFYDKPMALDSHNGTKLQEPSCVFLKARFRF